MLNKIVSHFDNHIYIQIWDNRIKATSIETGKIFDEKPLLAISLNKKGLKIVEGVGNEALLKNKNVIEVINPFSDKETLISNLGIGQKNFSTYICFVNEKTIFWFKASNCSSSKGKA